MKDPHVSPHIKIYISNVNEYSVWYYKYARFAEKFC